MTRIGDCFVRSCQRFNRIPAAVLCITIYILQAAAIDYYLVKYLGLSHLAWLGGDILVLILLVTTIIVSSSTLEQQKHDETATAYNFSWITWLVMHLLLAAKVIVTFLTFAVELEETEPTFFGPNTLKTAIALGSCVFLLLLTTQHDAPQSSERRKYIEDLTGTVFLDILDTTDILEILFSEEDRDQLSQGLEELVLAVATLNLVLPTVPLLTLSKTKFGHAKLRKNLVYLHRLLVVLAVNVPNLLVRLILWHGFSVGISPFTLKNIILIVMTMYEFYEHKLEKYEHHERERVMELQEKRDPNGRRPSPPLGGDKETCYVDVRDGYGYPGYGDGPTRRTYNNRESEKLSGHDDHPKVTAI